MQNQTGSTVPTKSRRLGVRLLGGLAGLFVTALLVNRWLLATDNPVIDIPKPILPSPNAYDYYVTAGNALLKARLLSLGKMSSPVVGVRTAEQEQDLIAMEAEIKQYAPAFQTLHQGFACEFCPLATRTWYPYTNASATFRNVARVLFTQGRVRAARGDWGGAADSALDGIQFGEEIQRNGNLIDHLTGNACQAIGQRPIWDTVAHLNAGQSRSAAERLQKIMERHFTYADTLQEEKWQGLASMNMIFRGVTIRNVLSISEGMDPDHPSLKQRYRTAAYLLYAKKRMFRDNMTYMDQLSEHARQPYGLHLPLPPMPTDPWNSLRLPVYNSSQLRDVETKTQNGLLLVTLALHAFQLEKGRRPASLEELSPGYLKKLPDDPFAAQGSFKYRIQGKSYILYSVGPDGKDDGGTPINDPKYVGPIGKWQRYVVKNGTLGDIVAGVNFP